MQITKLAIFGDTHLGYDKPVRPKLDKPRRGDDFFRNYEYVINYAITRKIGYLIHLGDLFNRSKPPALLVENIFSVLKKAAENGVKIFIIPGNHERSFIPGSLFDRHPEIFIFDKAVTQTEVNSEIPFSLGGFPFYRGNIRKEFQNIISSLHTDKSLFNILLFHHAVDGAQVGVKNYTFREREDVINPVEIPEDYNIVFSGHIHRHQILEKNHKNENIPVPIVYAGSIERTSFVERDEPKGFIELTLYPEMKYSLSFIELPTRKMYSVKVTENNLAKIINRLENLPEHSVLQLIFGINPSETDYKLIKQIEREILWPKDVIIEYSFPKR